MSMCYVEHLVYLAEYFLLLNHNFVLPRLDFFEVSGVNVVGFVGAFGDLVDVLNDILKPNFNKTLQKCGKTRLFTNNNKKFYFNLC